MEQIKPGKNAVENLFKWICKNKLDPISTYINRYSGNNYRTGNNPARTEVAMLSIGQLLLDHLLKDDGILSKFTNAITEK